MRFLNPILLAGLLAVAVPILIHLINRRRAVHVQFPAMEFLLRSNRKLARRLKLKQLLLLALRIGIFLLLPLAMAQPYMLCGGDTTSASDRMPGSVVIVVDDSASMTWHARGDTLYEQAIDEAERIVRGLRSWDQVALVFAHDPPEIVVGDLTDDRREIVQALTRHEPAFTGSDLPAALAIARDIQMTSRLPNRRTIVLTDDAATAWDDTTTDPTSLGGLGTVQVIDVGPEGSRENLALTELIYEEADAGGVGNFRIDATVRGYDFDETTRAEATLYVNDQAVGTTVTEVAPDRPGIASFTHRFEGGGMFEVRVELDEDRGAEADNTRFLTLQLDRAVNALLVNGDARSVAYNDELFYLEHALESRAGDTRRVEHTSIAPDRLTSARLEEFDVVVLANVASLPPVEVERLEAFVRAGGGLWFTSGDNVDPDRWNSLFPNLLPKPIRSITVLSERDDPDANIKATRVGTLDTSHPIFRVFSLPGGDSMQSVTAYSYVLLEPSTSEESSIIASYGDGGPALLERRVGQGRVALWTTTIDFDWTDMPIRTAYVPFVHRVLEFLARRGGESSDQTIVGERARMEVAALQAERIIVIDTEGNRNVLEIEEGDVSYHPPSPGHYRVLATMGGEDVPVEELSFAANLPEDEADTRPASEEIRGPYLEGAASGVEGTGTALDVPEQRTTLWPILLFLLLVIFYGESLLSIRRRLWERVRDRVRGRKATTDLEEV